MHDMHEPVGSYQGEAGSTYILFIANEVLQATPSFQRVC